jgi:hypothetical protein
VIVSEWGVEAKVVIIIIIIIMRGVGIHRTQKRTKAKNKG